MWSDRAEWNTSITPAENTSGYGTPASPFCISRAAIMSSLLSNSRLGHFASRFYPPVFLAPALLPFCQTSASFSTSSSVAQRTTRKKHARHPNRGVSALRRTGLRHPVEMDRYPLPVPVLDPEKRSKVAVDENHGLWGFFRLDKKALNTPQETAAFGLLLLRLAHWL